MSVLVLVLVLVRVLYLGQRQTPSRPLRYRDEIGLDAVPLPNAPWDLTKGFTGKVEFVPAAALPLGPIEWRVGSVFCIS